MIRIRPYTEGDAGQMVPLMADLGYPSTAEEIRARIAAMPSGTHHTLVAEFSGMVVGFIGLVILPVYEYSASLGYIVAMSVSSTHQRKGIGKALMIAAENHFRGHGVKDLRVNSGLKREEAHLFYECVGFQKTGHRFRKVLGASPG